MPEPQSFLRLLNGFVLVSRQKVSFIFESESQKFKDNGLFERTRCAFETHELLEEIMYCNKSWGSQGKNDLIRGSCEEI